MNCKLTFAGGAGSVTGANFLLEGNNMRILVDCGMVQSAQFCDACNWEPFPYDPASIDALLVTHAHIDHTGRIPYLVHNGFTGRIYSTEATRDLSELMLSDSMDILAREALREGKSPLYDESDLKQTFKLWETVPYHKPIELPNSFEALFKDAGHILGSSMIEITHTEGEQRRIAFTGDLGNKDSLLLPDNEVVTDVDYLVMESVYGDRVHENVPARTDHLRQVIVETISKGGVLLVPAFSIERTQIMLFELNQLIEAGKIPPVPVYLDSPLAINVTRLYRKHKALLNADRKQQILTGDDIFDFPGLAQTLEREASDAIHKESGPKIIIAGAGMSHGGRIQKHEAKYLPDPKNALLLVGYQAAGSVGRRLQEGAREVTISGKSVEVRARIETITGYSAHKDRDQLLEFASHLSRRIKQVFVAMGEPKSSLFLAQRLRDYLDLPAAVPQKGESFALEL